MKKSEKQKFISNKIKTIEHEGIRGKKVPIKQAIAVAYSYATKNGKQAKAEA